MRKLIHIFLILSVLFVSSCYGVTYAGGMSSSKKDKIETFFLAPMSQLDSMDLTASLKYLREKGLLKSSIHSLFDRFKKVYGGKGFWCKVLEEFQDKIPYLLPKTRYVKVEDLWGPVYWQNQATFNRLRDVKKDTSLSPLEMERKLADIIEEIEIPSKTMDLIKSIVEEFNGAKVIIRSSGSIEDGFEQNLAGIFTSKTAKNSDEAIRAVEKIVHQALTQVWVNGDKLSGVGSLEGFLGEQEGLALVIQEYKHFEASGTAMSYGQKSFLETVFGNPTEAVNATGANHVLMERNSNKEILVDAAYKEYPDAFNGIQLKELPFDHDLKRAILHYEHFQESMEEYFEEEGDFSEMDVGEGANQRRVYSPLDKTNANRLFDIIGFLEEELGFNIDSEWGVQYRDPYLLQIRPIIGVDNSYKRKPSSKFSQKIENQEYSEIASSRNVIGSGEFQGPVVVVGENFTPESLQKIEQDYADGYVLVMKNAAENAMLNNIKNARVVVDPVFSSLGAHGVSGSRGYFNENSLIYANGFALSNALAQKLEYEMHPSLDGVFIAKNELAVYSNGTETNVFSTQTEKSQASVEMSGMVAAKSNFLKYLMELVGDHRYEELAAPWAIFNAVSETIFSEGLLKDSSFPVNELLNIAEEYSVPKVIADKLLDLCGKDDLEQLRPQFEAFLDVYSSPLISKLSTIEKIALDRINVLCLTALNIEASAATQFKTYEPRKSGKTRVLVLNDVHAAATRSSVMELLEKAGVADQFEIVATSRYTEAADEILKGDYDAAILDAEVKGGGETIFQEAMKQTAFPLVMFDTGWQGNKGSFFSKKYSTKGDWWQDDFTQSGKNFKSIFQELEEKGAFIGTVNDGLAFAPTTSTAMADALMQLDQVLKLSIEKSKAVEQSKAKSKKKSSKPRGEGLGHSKGSSRSDDQAVKMVEKSNGELKQDSQDSLSKKKSSFLADKLNPSRLVKAVRGLFSNSL